MNKILIALVLVVVMSGNVFAYKITEKELRAQVNEMNKTMPRAYSQGILMLNMGYREPFTIVYNLMYTENSKDSITITDQMDRMFSNALCSNPETIDAINQGVTFEGHYYDKDYIYVGKIVAKKSDC